MKIKKNLAIKLVKDLIQEDKFKKQIIDLISSNSDSSGIAKNEEKKIFNNLLKVHKKTVDDVMIPRGEIIYLDQKIDKVNLIKIINKEAHSRMPVVNEDLENCLGMVHIKDIFKKINNKSLNIKSLLREVIYIPSATPVFNLLQKMKKQNIHLAIVMDEFNSVAGLVTIEDLVEEIVGEIEDEHDSEEAPLYRQSNKNLIMDAAMLVDDFERDLSESGSKKVRKVAQRFAQKAEIIDLLVSSPARRAFDTAKLWALHSGMAVQTVQTDSKIYRARLGSFITFMERL